MKKQQNFFHEFMTTSQKLVRSVKIESKSKHFLNNSKPKQLRDSFARVW